ncbi:MAG: cyclodeaminase/cyclohydrolase family protein, partial [Acidaminococcaceae bacterium]|nr:cyclodeaminase/cyclohydrolase family protein [Acidaminococcaceae bacterium]
EGNRMLVTDGGASALLARACQRVAAYNVKINLGGVADPVFKARAQQELERQLADGKALEEEVLKEVDARI